MAYAALFHVSRVCKPLFSLMALPVTRVRL